MLVDRLLQFDHDLIIAGGVSSRVVRVVVTRRGWFALAAEVGKARLGEAFWSTDGVIRIPRSEGSLEIVQDEPGAERSSLDKLLGCPFCGSQEIACDCVRPESLRMGEHWMVGCHMCGMGRGGFASRAQAVVAWNQRR